MKIHKLNVNSAKARTKGEAGFTLIETSIALVVMMIVGLGAASLFFYALGANSSARDRELSMAVAQQQMEFLRNSDFFQLDAAVASLGGSPRTATNANRQYTVVTTISNTIAGNDTNKTIMIEVRPRGTGALAGVARVFGGVTLVTQRASTGTGGNIGP